MARRLERLVGAVLLACAAAAPAAPSWNVERLLAGFAQTPEARASFVERRTVRVLDKALVSSGELRFAAPDRLEKRTLRPRAELLVLAGDLLTIERGERRLQLDLRSHPEVAAFVQSIRGTLAGDREALERSYRLALEGGEASWTLTLVPRTSAMAALVQHVRIAGRRADISVIEILQANGDSSLMSVQRLPAPR